MHQIEKDFMAQQEAEYATWAQEHAAELEAEAHREWVEGLCEGHESLRGDMMGTEEYCDGTCRPTSERSYDAWVAATEADEPSDCW